MLASLGLFVFTLSTIPYQTKETTRSWRHKRSERVGRIQSSQFTGADARTIAISGTLHPEITGGLITIGLLESMADAGAAWPYVTGTGDVVGLYVITDIKYTETETHSNGRARKIDFSMTLSEVHDYDLLGDALNAATQYVPVGFRGI
jgi:uncharacterized protein